MKQLFKSKAQAVMTYFGRRSKEMTNFHGAITALAHQKWEEAGRPEGRDIEFWVAAERELWTKFGNRIPNG